ncbi:MAG: hypothetical protein GX853_00470 [Chloroflexi bacterium]|nr:hypothetical protein [Chloroflexota bacterium]
MKLIKMLDDYTVMVEESKTIGQFAAYQAYTEKHPVLFKFIFEGLYMMPLDILKPMIENADFDTLLLNGQKNRADGVEQKVAEMTREVADYYGFEDDFDLYLGMELGNIGGCVGEPVGNRPFMFIGLEILRSDSHWRQLVAHEFNHMVRFWKLARGMKFSDIDFLNRTIAEGLGVCSGLMIDGKAFSLDVFAKHNGLTEEQHKDLIENESIICTEVRRHFGKPMTVELNNQFLVGSLDPQHWQKAYYYGAKIINSLVESGYKLTDLTLISAVDILEAYDSLE